jgi:hypothetical protein
MDILSLEALPYEMLTHALECLTYQDLISYMATSCHSHELKADEIYWRNRVKKDFLIDPDLIYPGLDMFETYTKLFQQEQEWKEMSKRSRELLVDTSPQTIFAVDEKDDETTWCKSYVKELPHWTVMSTMLKLILKELQRMEDSSTEVPRMHFTGSDWSPQGFIRESNHLRLGFISKSDTVAIISLQLIKAIVDNNSYYFECELEEILHEETAVSVENMIERLSMDDYHLSFSLLGKYTTSMTGRKGDIRVESDITKVNIWTLARLNLEENMERLEDILSG